MKFLAAISSADGPRFVKQPKCQGTEFGQVADTGAVATGKPPGQGNGARFFVWLGCLLVSWRQGWGTILSL